jgi:hypothetical protein
LRIPHPAIRQQTLKVKKILRTVLTVGSCTSSSLLRTAELITTPSIVLSRGTMASDMLLLLLELPSE